MSNRPQRGRAAPKAAQPNPMRIFYALLAIIVVAGVAIVGTTFLGNKQPSPAPQSGSGANPAAPQAGGRTADGFYYKGNSDAKIIVTEYSDYQ